MVFREWEQAGSRHQKYIISCLVAPSIFNHQNFPVACPGILEIQVFMNINNGNNMSVLFPLPFGGYNKLQFRALRNIDKQPDGSFTVPWFLKNRVLVLAKRTFWVQKYILKKINRKMFSSTLPAICGPKRTKFGFQTCSEQCPWIALLSICKHVCA